MLESVFNFVFTVPVANSALRAIIMVAEILFMGVVLYWCWELLPRLVRGIAKIGSAADMSDTARPEKAQAGARSRGSL